MPRTKAHVEPVQNARSGTGKRSSDGTSTYVPPLTTTHKELLTAEGDSGFRAVVYMMNTALTRLQVCREAFAQSISLTGTQFAVLMGVAHRQLERGVTIRALATHLSIASTHVTTEVGKLVDLGYLRKSRHETDKRSVLISLTARGAECVDAISPLVQRVNDHLFAGISAAEFKIMGDVLTKIVLNSEFALAELRLQKKGGVIERMSARR